MARTQACPRCDVGSGREPTHIRVDLVYQHFRDLSPDTGDAIQPLDDSFSRANAVVTGVLSISKERHFTLRVDRSVVGMLCAGLRGVVISSVVSCRGSPAGPICRSVIEACIVRRPRERRRPCCVRPYEAKIRADCHWRVNHTSEQGMIDEAHASVVGRWMGEELVDPFAVRLGARARDEHEPKRRKVRISGIPVHTR